MKEANDLVKLMRHSLGGIDLSDAVDKEMSEQERKDYCAAINAVIPRLEKDLRRFMYQQVLFTAQESETWEQVVFGKGFLGGMSALLEHWSLASNEHINQSGGAFNAHSPIGEI